MRIITNFANANDLLSQFATSTMEPTTYTLETIKDFMAMLGNPQNNLKIIHVAGTSGKTSTAYFAASLLHSAGYRVGLTVSPHIDQINERAQIDLESLSESEYCQELSIFLDLVEDSKLKLSYFEILVSFAYWLFDKRGVEYAVVEVGLGGLLDGTNVIARQDKVCIITDIGLDHTKVLGNTISEIAYQKAGIIYDTNVVFMNEQPKEVIDVITQVSKKKNATLNILKPTVNNLDNSIQLPLFQKRNLLLALTAIEYVLKRDSHNELTPAMIKDAARIYIPGRMEVMTYQGKTLVLDGSHNEQKITALVDSMKQQFPDTTITMLVSFGANKITSVIASLKLLRQLGSSIIITEFVASQDELRVPIKVEALKDYADQAGFKDIVCQANSTKALKLLLEDQNSIGLITGSFYLLHHVRDIIFNEN